MGNTGLTKLPPLNKDIRELAEGMAKNWIEGAQQMPIVKYLINTVPDFNESEYKIRSQSPDILLSRYSEFLSSTGKLAEAFFFADALDKLLRLKAKDQIESLANKLREKMLEAGMDGEIPDNMLDDILKKGSTK